MLPLDIAPAGAIGRAGCAGGGGRLVAFGACHSPGGGAKAGPVETSVLADLSPPFPVRVALACFPFPGPCLGCCGASFPRLERRGEGAVRRRGEADASRFHCVVYVCRAPPQTEQYEALEDRLA